MVFLFFYLGKVLLTKGQLQNTETSATITRFFLKVKEWVGSKDQSRRCTNEEHLPSYFRTRETKLKAKISNQEFPIKKFF